MKLVRVYADEAGDTHLADIDVPAADDVGGAVSELLPLRDIPATTISLSQSPDHRADMDFHTPSATPAGRVLAWGTGSDDHDG